MAQVELVMPKMGESIMEATILNWVKNVGDQVEEDETILEIATDKVDSEVPSPASGTIKEIYYDVDDTVEVGKVIAMIATEAEAEGSDSNAGGGSGSQDTTDTNGQSPKKEDSAAAAAPPEEKPEPATLSSGSGNRFYSPLVRNIAQKENISQEELEQIPGTGAQGRVTKHDILAYLEERKTAPQPSAPSTTARESAGPKTKQPATSRQGAVPEPPKYESGYQGRTEIVEMDRMRKMIADHMVHSKRTSPHVTSFVEIDMTKIVQWRNRVKQEFMDKQGEKITFTPIFVEAVVKALQDFPRVNVSVDGYEIIVKKDLNIGMATALPNGNLIVPVIKNADQYNLLGLTKQVNDLARRARENKLKAEEIQGGTFTLTNVGTFGNVMGTPIINQPQAAIMATGAIQKKPAVVETEYGDVIAIRHKMFLSLSYDHRVVDGFLGGSFLSKVGAYLEAFDPQRKF